MEVLKEYIQQMLQEGKIHAFLSASGSPILCIPKPNGRGLRLCVNYHQINKIMVKDRTPLPLMDELLDAMAGATQIIKLDAKNGFKLVCLGEDDEWKTAL